MDIFAIAVALIVLGFYAVTFVLWKRNKGGAELPGDDEREETVTALLGVVAPNFEEKK